MTKNEIETILNGKKFLIHDVKTVLGYIPEEGNIDREQFVSLLEKGRFPVHDINTIATAVYG